MFLAQLFYRANLRDGAQQFGFSLGQFNFIGSFPHGILGALLRGPCRRFVQIAGAGGGIGQHGHEMWLNFQHTTADVERLVLVAFGSHAHHTGFNVVSSGACRG